MVGTFDVGMERFCAKTRVCPVRILIRLRECAGSSLRWARISKGHFLTSLLKCMLHVHWHHKTITILIIHYNYDCIPYIMVHGVHQCIFFIKVRTGMYYDLGVHGELGVHEDVLEAPH